METFESLVLRLRAEFVRRGSITSGGDSDDSAFESLLELLRRDFEALWTENLELRKRLGEEPRLEEPEAAVSREAADEEVASLTEPLPEEVVSRMSNADFLKSSNEEATSFSEPGPEEVLQTSDADLPKPTSDSALTVRCFDYRQVFATRCEASVATCVDFHGPDKPWVLVARSSGQASVWDYERQQLVQELAVSDTPVRCAKFVAREGGIVVAASDDMFLRVYGTSEVKELGTTTWDLRLEVEAAHDDYIRHLEVHTSQPFLLSSSDDALVKMWDMDQEFLCLQVFEAHTAGVTMCRWDPGRSDPSATSFASCSVDASIRIWGPFSFAEARETGDGLTEAEVRSMTFVGHDAGVTCVDYSFEERAEGAQVLVSGSEDRTVRLWDLGTGNLLQVLKGHLSTVTAALFHPRLPIILTGSEDRTIQVWNIDTCEVEETWDHLMSGITSFARVASVGALGMMDADASAPAVIGVGHEQGLWVAELSATFASVVKLHDRKLGPDGWEVHYTAGSGKLTALAVKEDLRVAGLRVIFAERLEVPLRQLKMVMSDGRRLGDADGRMLVVELFT